MTIGAKEQAVTTPNSVDEPVSLNRYSGKAKNVILCAFSRAQIVAIKSIVKQADPDAFIIVCDAYEILGEGFGVNTPNGL